jgi:hypothetical protein
MPAPLCTHLSALVEFAVSWLTLLSGVWCSVRRRPNRVNFTAGQA